MSCPFNHASATQDATSAVPVPPDDADDVPEGEPIPHPPESWFMGNLPEIDPSFAVSSQWRLADIYGPIYSLNLVRRKVIVVSSYDLINEACNDTLFEKKVVGVQETVRALTKNGLFTAYNDEEEWGIAHRTLVPAFGPIHVKSMFPQMVDALSQMVLRWDRFGPDHRINCIDDFTRLAFEVIGLCAFNYRFNAFYGENLPPFAISLVDTLVEVGKRSIRLDLENWLRFRSRQKMTDDIHFMWDVCDKIVAERKANPRPELNDLLNTMLTAKDPVTGKGLPDENIRFQMVTFLVAGHDTSAGTMNFLFYNLLQHPEKLQKCYAEVDTVVGDRPLELSDLPKLQFIEASIRETLRYLGPIPIIVRGPKKPLLLGGKYKVTPDTPLLFNLKGLHHDPSVWGEDANEFKPERFMDGGWDRVPPNAWKAFGSGVRQCIGRYLAEQEIIIAMAMVLQRFIVEQADPDYELKIRSTLTLKPDQFYIKVRRRPGRDHLFQFTGGAAPPQAKPAGPATDIPSNLEPLTVFYGGNTGTCKSFGEDIQSNAPRFGFGVDEVKNLDEAVENLPTDRPVVIVTASYEGLPPDNAKNLVAWLEARAGDAGSEKLLSGVTYAVFGVGNRDWAATFHRIPKLVDGLLEKLGATRLVPAGFVDVGQDISGPFEDFKARLFAKLRKSAGVTAEVKEEELKVEVSAPDAPSKLAGEPVSEALVLANNVLVNKGAGPEKRHMDILLPPGVEYRSGDYVVVQPFNPSASATRVLNRFGLHPDDVVTVSGTTKEHLKGALSVWDLVNSRVELSSPASQRQVATLAKLASGADAARLEALASDELYEKECLEKRLSVLDLIEDYPSVSLSFGAYLDMLAPLAPRQYSISSSPLARPAIPASQTAFGAPTDDDGLSGGASLTASITYDVLSDASYGNSTRPFNGVASSYLAHLPPGSRLRCFVRSTAAPFRLPLDPKTPVIFIAAGTGIAPMRAFIGDRTAMAAARPGGAKTNLGAAVLYYGFRNYDEDYLYREELEKAEADGVVTVRVAASRHAGLGRHVGHVDEIIWEDREELRALFKAGARILVCGSAARLGKSTQEVCLKIYREANPEATVEEAQAWLLRQKEDRYVSDVFG